MRRNRTATPPFFSADSRPLGANWSWTVTLQIASSGYVHGALVSARRVHDGDELVGTASCDVAVGDDVTEVIECLAVESMLAACEPTLDGSTSTRRVVFSSTL